MRKLISILFLIFLIKIGYSQNDNSSSNLIVTGSFWDQGVPFCPDDEYIDSLMGKIDFHRIRDTSSLTTFEKSICLEIGLAFYARHEYEEANWYFNRSVEHDIQSQISAGKEYRYLIKEIRVPTPPQENLSETDQKQLKNDANFLQALPSSYDNLSNEDLKAVAKKIDEKIKRLLAEKDSLQQVKAAPQVIDSKTGTIKTLSKEKEIIDLTIVREELQVENTDLTIEGSRLKNYLIWAVAILTLMGLSIIALLQRKTIKVQDKEIERQLADINTKNTYLEHAARIIRHDMHSGINTYIPRGLTSLEKKLTPEEIKNLKIEASVKMIKEGLNHTQKVYKSVYEFTNLVKQKVVLDKAEINLTELLKKHIASTAYSSQVTIDELPVVNVNEILFWNAIDSLIKNGLKYNKSSDKLIKIYMDKNYLIVEDNGIGLSEKRFKKILAMSIDESNEDSGLGLNICNAILKEHEFELICEKMEIGTRMKIALWVTEAKKEVPLAK